MGGASSACCAISGWRNRRGHRVRHTEVGASRQLRWVDAAHRVGTSCVSGLAVECWLVASIFGLSTTISDRRCLDKLLDGVGGFGPVVVYTHDLRNTSDNFDFGTNDLRGAAAAAASAIGSRHLGARRRGPQTRQR